MDNLMSPFVLLAKTVTTSDAAATDNWMRLAYLVAAMLFILGIKGMTHPRTAVRGNLLGACGMLLAVVVTLIWGTGVSYPVVIAGLLV